MSFQIDFTKNENGNYLLTVDDKCVNDGIGISAIYSSIFVIN